MTTTSNSKRGRRSLLNATVQKKICAVLEKAGTVTTACAFAGIGTTSYHEWVRRGEAGEAGYAQFAASCARAKATAKQMLTDIILRAAPRDPKMACWLLEKLYPREFGRDASPQEPPPKPLLPPLPEIEFSAAEFSEIVDGLNKSAEQLAAARNAANS